LLGERLLGEVAQDPFVECGEGVELGGGEQVDETPALGDPASAVERTRLLPISDGNSS
jgi:hypothetical protein